MLPYCPPYRLALRSTSLGGSRRAPLARHQLDELSLWVVELAPRLRRALPSPPGGSPHVQSRRPPARALPLAAARSATIPVASRSPPQVAERKSLRLFPPHYETVYPPW
ncbi:hypothetical protein C8J57DRAFT_1524886 [Mycena rebaudengoi]|nr:hypothetical protein C8J57DRAFT_1524886 [Mycena rebaudengoi]